MDRKEKDVFISYYAGFEEKIFLKKLLNTFKNKKISYFCTEELPVGTYFTDDIFKNLEKCKIGIILCTEKSICRPWVNFEAGYMFAKGIPLLLIGYNIDESKLEKKFPLYMFTKPKSIYFYKENNDEKFIEEICSELNKLLSNKRSQFSNFNSYKDESKDKSILVYYPYKFGPFCPNIINDNCLASCVDNNLDRKFAEAINSFLKICKIENNIGNLDISGKCLNDDLLEKSRFIFIWGSLKNYYDPIYYFLAGFNYYKFDNIPVISYSYINPRDISSPISNFHIFHQEILECINGNNISVKGISDIDEFLKNLVYTIAEIVKIKNLKNCDIKKGLDYFRSFYSYIQTFATSINTERTIFAKSGVNNFLQEINY